MSLLDKEKYTKVKCMEVSSSTIANMSSAPVIYALLEYFSLDVLTIHLKMSKTFISTSVVHVLAATCLAPWLA